MIFSVVSGGGEEQIFIFILWLAGRTFNRVLHTACCGRTRWRADEDSAAAGLKKNKNKTTPSRGIIIPSPPPVHAYYSILININAQRFSGSQYACAFSDFPMEFLLLLAPTKSRIIVSHSVRYVHYTQLCTLNDLVKWVFLKSRNKSNHFK